MKEYIDTLVDKFFDYAGREHQFVIVTISSMLPSRTKDLEDSPTDDDFLEVYHDVTEYIEDYGSSKYLGNVTKAVRIGISICNPTDTFNPRIGIAKAENRARNSSPVLYAKDKGDLGTEVIKALMEQTARYIKNSPGNYIKGYDKQRDRFYKNVAKQNLIDSFDDLERTIYNKLKENPKFLDKINECLR